MARTARTARNTRLRPGIRIPTMGVLKGGSSGCARFGFLSFFFDLRVLFVFVLLYAFHGFDGLVQGGLSLDEETFKQGFRLLQQTKSLLFAHMSSIGSGSVSSSLKIVCCSQIRRFLWVLLEHAITCMEFALFGLVFVFQYFKIRWWNDTNIMKFSCVLLK